MSLQQKIDRITDILRRDDGISGAMHYTEQTSWVLFLKFLDDYESEKEDEAVLSGKYYQPVLDDEHRWASWACPKAADGKLDLARAKTGDDLTDYVNNQLFPYLKSFANAAATGADPKSFTYKIGAIYQYLDNKVASGHTLREVLDIVDSLNFQSESDLFQLSLVYEGLLQNMGDAGGYAGEFYTPRPVVRAMVQAIDPKPGETIYDAAAGSCGFLVEAFEHLKNKRNQLSTEQWDFIQRDTFFGFEKTSLAYVMGMMNMILHGIESPNLFRGNTLTQNIRDIQEKDRYDIILANPPFGGKEKSQIQQNFPIQSNATELLFLQHFMKTLKSGGKAAIVVPEGVLFQTNSAFKQVKQELLENFNLHTILSLPAGVFLPYSGVKTNVLFFERSGGTSNAWYYECEPEQKLTKNKPITDEHLKEFVELYNSRETTDRSWTVSASRLAEDYDLSAKNPSKASNKSEPSALEIIQSIKARDSDIESGLLDIDREVTEKISSRTGNWIKEKLGNLIKLHYGKALKAADRVHGEIPVYGSNGIVGYHNKPLWEKPTVIIGRKGSVGEANYCRGCSWTIDTAYYVEVLDASKLNLEYFYYFADQFDITAISQKGVKPGVNRNDYLNIEIPLPSIEEQNAIVDSLRKVYEKIEKGSRLYEDNIESLSSLKSSILSASFRL